MINRTLIRIRVLQELFAYYHNEGETVTEAEAKLKTSLERTHQLYLYLLSLIPALTRHHQWRIERRRRRLVQSAEDANPNMRLATNRLANAIAASDTLQRYLQQEGMTWSDDRLLTHLLDAILATPLYETYKNSADTFESDARFWVAAMAHIVLTHPDLDEYLENLSIYWDNPSALFEKIEIENDVDIEGVDAQVEELKGSDYYHAQRLSLTPVEIEKEFVLKTLRKACEEVPFDETLSPAYKDEESAAMAGQLLRATIQHAQELDELIDSSLKKWDVERIADTDLVIMKMAIAEMLSFSAIPTIVTLNEYIELVKVYSTPDSGRFINGVLDTILQQLRQEKRIHKL